MKGMGKNTTPKGLNIDKEVGKPNPYPGGKSNSTGSRGGMPGFSNTNNGGNVRSADGLLKGHAGSGHIASQTKLASMTGYTPGVVSAKAPSVTRNGPGTIGSTGGARGFKGSNGRGGKGK